MLEIDPLRDGPPPRAAATVVLLRDADAGLEVFLVRRTKGAAFMGGAYVFPGGKLDAADADPSLLARVRGIDAEGAQRALAEDLAPASALALYVAALRETFEESGVLFASSPRALDLAEARARLAGGASFAELAHELELSLDAAALVPFARWVTPAVEARRFDARFFVAVAPAGIVPRHDDAETITSVWKTPRGAIDAHASGAIDLPPPTLRTLEELSVHTRAEDAVAAARARRPPLVRPVFRDLGDGTWVLALPGDAEHPEPSAVLPGPTRFTLRDGRFVSG
ncbi:MAG: NUDIX hydrolase [Myxococcota bacterium]|nr:NUDIX hydrolase [Myxococcota bacterium]